MKKSKSDIKVLVIEDEIFILRDIEDILTTSLGIDNYELANSFSKADQLIQTERPDLILCDINLGDPDKDGIDYIANLRRVYKDFEVVYITAYFGDQLLKKAQLTHPLNYIIKPFNEQQLTIAIDMAIGSILSKSHEVIELSMLTPSEIRVVQFIKLGMDTSHIAEKLNVSQKTIKNHRYNICKKLNLPQEKNSLLKWVMSHHKSIPSRLF